MKKYSLKLKGTKKNNTKSLDLVIYGESKSQAFNYAFEFFQMGIFKEPFFATGLNRMSGGTLEFIPDSKNLMDIKGLYFVPRTSVNPIK